MKLIVVIVNYNLKEDTEQSIRSFLQAGAALPQIIVVDNGSSDNSASSLRSTFGDELNLIRTEEIRGNAHGLNLGIRAAETLNFDWVLLMNNDTYVDPQFLIEMETAINRFPEFDIFGPMILYASQPEKIWFMGQHLIPGTLLTYDPYRMKTANDSFPDVMEMDFLNGCSLLVHRCVFEKIGLFNSSLFMYGEEVDFLLRSRGAGFRMAAVPKARMWHKVSATMNQDKPGTRFLRVRNQIWIYRHNGNNWQILLMVFFTFFRIIFMSLRDILSGQLSLLKPSWKGFSDGWFRKIPSFLE